MTSSQTIEFSSKYCKSGLHGDCCGKWNGFGFYITCICSCHKSSYLKRKNIHQTYSIIPTSGVNDKILLYQENENLDFKHTQKNDLLVNSLQGFNQQASTAKGDD